MKHSETADKLKEKRILIFCPDIRGHRQIHCCVVSDWFLRFNFIVLLAVGRCPNGERAIAMPLIKYLSRKANIIILDLGNINEQILVPGSLVDPLSRIENDFSPEWTFLLSGDQVRDCLKGLGKRNKGIKRAALFITSGYFYRFDCSQQIFLRRIYKRFRWELHRFKENIYFKNIVWDHLGLKLAFSVDPIFIKELRDKRFHYIPDIYRTWDNDVSDFQILIRKLKSKYNVFLERHPKKEVILFFGTRSRYKGYDKLLFLAANHPDTIFVSCGRPLENEKYFYDIERLKLELEQQGRIFEVNIPFLSHNDFFEHLFHSCNFMVFPYDDFYRPSGIMVQATSFGKPVIVPSVGYMNHMVDEYNVGLTYKNNDIVDLFRKFNIIKKEYFKYSENALNFSKNFSRENIDGALSKGFF